MDGCDMGNLYTWRPQTYRNLYKITYCPGLAGVRGKKRSDSLASRTPFTLAPKMSRTGILRAVRDTLTWSNTAIEVTTRSHLLKLGLNIWTGSKDHRRI